MDKAGLNQYNGNLKMYLDSVYSTQYRPMIRKTGLPDNVIYDLGSDSFIPNMPQWLFLVVLILISYFAIKRNYSLIPVLGLLSCFYLMAQESHTNWWRFIIWLIIGLTIYFLYSRKNSKLAQ